MQKIKWPLCSTTQTCVDSLLFSKKSLENKTGKPKWVKIDDLKRQYSLGKWPIWTHFLKWSLCCSVRGCGSVEVWALVYTSGKHRLGPGPLHLPSCPFVMSLRWLGSPHVPGKTGTPQLLHQPVVDGGMGQMMLVPFSISWWWLHSVKEKAGIVASTYSSCRRRERRNSAWNERSRK